jgi:hypothetical protein
VKTVSGIVNGNGLGVVGRGYTVSRLEPGKYRVDFPAGTWPTIPVVTVSPFGLPGFFPVAGVASIVAFSNGSARVDIYISATAGSVTYADSAFQFIAAASLP